MVNGNTSCFPYTTFELLNSEKQPAVIIIAFAVNLDTEILDLFFVILRPPFCHAPRKRGIHLRL